MISDVLHNGRTSMPTTEQLHAWADAAAASGNMRLANAFQLAAFEVEAMPIELRREIVNEIAKLA